MFQVNPLSIGIKGAGEMASAIAHRLYKAGFQHIFMMDIHAPLAVRREVSFCEALIRGRKVVENVEAILVNDSQEIYECWNDNKIAVIGDPNWSVVNTIKPNVLIDAIVAKRNRGTTTKEAPLVIGLGPGFTAGQDVHFLVETNRGHNLGRIITTGPAEPDTGIPGSIMGHTEERVFRAPMDGFFSTERKIGDIIKQGETIGYVAEESVRAQIGGVVRGLIRPNIKVTTGLKIGDIDPRGEVSYCYTISDKARNVSGAVLEAILRSKNAPH